MFQIGVVVLLLLVVCHDPPGRWHEHRGDDLWILQHVYNAALEHLTGVRLQITHPGKTVLPELIDDAAALLRKVLDGDMEVVVLIGGGVGVDLQSLLELLEIILGHAHLSLHQQNVRLVRAGQRIFFQRL